jgi:hypothetical protein
MTSARAETINIQHLQRALELAEQAHLTGTATLIATGRLGESFTVPSRDRCNQHHVFVDRVGVTHCDCQASQFGRVCAHAGAVYHYRRQRAVALARTDKHDEAMANWLAGFA